MTDDVPEATSERKEPCDVPDVELVEEEQDDDAPKPGGRCRLSCACVMAVCCKLCCRQRKRRKPKTGVARGKRKAR